MTTEVSASCSFCPTAKKELYICPKCQAKYCSVACYRSEKHEQCSEQFYRQCVETELSGKRSDRPLREDLMRMASDGQIGGDIPLGDGDDGDDSDDCDDGNEDDEYIARVISDAKGQLDQADEGDLDRKLTSLGVGTECDSLLAALTPAERRQFLQLAEEYETEQSGLERSVFSKGRSS